MLARLDVPWQWLIVGDGPDAGNVRDHVGKLGVGDRVHMTGAVPADEVPRYYGLGDVPDVVAQRDAGPDLPGVAGVGRAGGVPRR